MSQLILIYLYIITYPHSISEKPGLVTCNLHFLHYLQPGPNLSGAQSQMRQGAKNPADNCKKSVAPLLRCLEFQTCPNTFTEPQAA